jgi:hypothetical protein
MPYIPVILNVPSYLAFCQVEAPLDPMKELGRLISERKFDEAFTVALQRSDVSIVSWLCSQVSSSFINQLMQNYNFFKTELYDLCSLLPS